MVSASIVKLDAPANIAGIAHGAKAANIVHMGRAGLPVPPGFCIPGTACRQHLRAAGILLQLTTALPELEDADAQDKRNILADIRKRIADAPLENGLSDRIADHYRTLDSDAVAIRSSATAEDLPHQSFAGQYDTFLNVTSLKTCIKSVKKCWASLWTERAFDYRRQNGIDHIDVDMAVIVQQMVEADVSGIIFTADPLSGDRDKILIEAAPGLGEDIVRGNVTPDRCVLKKTTLTITEYKPAGPNAAHCINNSTTKRLAKLAIKVEAYFSEPQDIEWSMKDRQIWLLQTRPITTLPQIAEKSPQDQGIWSHFPAQEVLPDVVTPVTKSILDAITDPLLQPVFDMLCIDRCDHPIYDHIAGRVYFNAALMIAAIDAMPGSGAIDFSEMAGSDPDLNRIIEFAEKTPPQDLPKIKFHKFRFFLKLPLLAGRFLLAGPAKGEAFMAKAIASNRRSSLADPAAMTSDQILESCSTLTEDIRQLSSGIIYLFDVFAAFPALQFLCQRWFREPAYAGRLVAGLGNMTDAEAALDLWKLAKIGDNLPELKERILSQDTWQAISEELPGIPGAETFLTAWNKFMHDHGHHCRAEIELVNPRWSERPDYILSLIRGYLDSIDRTDPVENHKKIAEDRCRLEQDCRSKLRNPIKRRLFNRILKRAQIGSRWRENIKSELIKILANMRKMLLELAHRLQADNTLANPDDIFFLKLEEVPAVVQGSANFDIKQLIADRRAEYDKWAAITPPSTIVGAFVPENYVPDPVETDVETLEGLALSPGAATGKAKVILRTDTDQHLRAGEILVAPFTDPGWTPYFIPAVAIVTERGGLLSHGAIVARELGIPAVTNVGPVTQIIKTGQTIQVDGNAGTVKILK